MGLKTAQQGAENSLKLATDIPGTYEKGALYIDKMKKAPKFLAPLLYNDEQCNVVMQDTIKFLEKFTNDMDASRLMLETQVTPSTEYSSSSCLNSFHLQLSPQIPHHQLIRYLQKRERQDIYKRKN